MRMLETDNGPSITVIDMVRAALVIFRPFEQAAARRPTPSPCCPSGPSDHSPGAARGHRASPFSEEEPPRDLAARPFDGATV